MSKKLELILYSTRDCHLCQEAAYLLQQSSLEFDLVYVDIADSEALVEKYGIRIPVIKKQDSELGWPFDLEILESFILQ